MDSFALIPVRPSVRIQLLTHSPLSYSNLLTAHFERQDLVGDIKILPLLFKVDPVGEGHQPPYRIRCFKVPIGLVNPRTFPVLL